MRNTPPYFAATFLVAAHFACTWTQPTFANDSQDGHAMAHQFANAHKPKPTKVKPENAIQANEVEGAFKVRSQENELKNTDQISASIEARTRAIESLLEQNTADKWDVRVGKPATVVIEASPEIDSAVEATAPQTSPKLTDSNVGPWAATTSQKPLDQTNAGQTETAADIGVAPRQVTPTTPDTGLEPTETTQQLSPPVDDVIALPEPGYALGGPANLRRGLAEASSILSTATVLLKMQPGNKGLRRFKKTADPVLCGRRHCYMSQGFDQKADRMQRGATLGPYNTLGRRAGACRQKLSCAFRHVDLMDEGVLLQPVDLKFMRHDRRAYRNIKADKTCKISAGRLHCAKPIKAKTWSAWIVPEHIAVQAGRDGLETALQDGLPETPISTIHVKRTKPTAAP